MSTPRFFADPLAPGVLTLDEQESRHLRGARRLAQGDQVVLVNGRGDEGFGSVISLRNKKRVEVEVLRVGHRSRSTPELTMAVALPRGPRQDWLIEKCTELGVAAIQPIITQRSISEASPHRIGRWRQIAIEAMKQSGQAWLPALHEPVPFAGVLARAGAFGGAYIATGEAAQRAAHVSWPARILALVGPEGDWTPAELEAARVAGAQPISLGPGVLRVETAAISIAALLHSAVDA